MAKVDAPDLGEPTKVPTGTWGTVRHARASVTIPSATAIDDVVNFIELPRGCVPIDAYALMDGAATNTSDMRLGLKRTDDTGDDDDDDHFFGDTDINAAGTTRATPASAPPVLDDGDYYVQGTIKAATPGADTVVDVVVIYDYAGLE